MTHVDWVHQIVVVVAEVPAVVLAVHHLTVVILVVLRLLQGDRMSAQCHKPPVTGRYGTVPTFILMAIPSKSFARNIVT